MLTDVSARVLGVALRGVVGLATFLVEQPVGSMVPPAEPGFVGPSVPSARVRRSSTPATSFGPDRSQSEYHPKQLVSTIGVGALPRGAPRSSTTWLLIRP